MKYQQLTVSEREKIQEGLWAHKSLSSIALDIGRHVSTVTRKLQRNNPPIRKVYTPRLAQERADEKKKSEEEKNISKTICVKNDLCQTKVEMS